MANNAVRYTAICPDGRVRHGDPFEDVGAARAWSVYGCPCRLTPDLRQHGIVRIVGRPRILAILDALDPPTDAAA